MTQGILNKLWKYQVFKIDRPKVMWRTPSEPCLLVCRRRLQPYSAAGAVWVSILTTSCLLSSLSDRFCKEKLRMSRFAKRGNTIQLRLGVRLYLLRGRRMGDILRMAF